MSDYRAPVGLVIWYVDGRLGKEYVPITFDDLAVHVDEMAAVAWDRDQEEILRGREISGSIRVLVSDRGCYLMTGYHTCLARWDSVDKKWLRSL